jgi:hypothetical protein
VAQQQVNNPKPRRISQGLECKNKIVHFLFYFVDYLNGS